MPRHVHAAFRCARLGCPFTNSSLSRLYTPHVSPFTQAANRAVVNANGTRLGESVIAVNHLVAALPPHLHTPTASGARAGSSMASHAATSASAPASAAAKAAALTSDPSMDRAIGSDGMQVVDDIDGTPHAGATAQHDSSALALDGLRMASGGDDDDDMDDDIEGIDGIDEEGSDEKGEGKTDKGGQPGGSRTGSRRANRGGEVDKGATAAGLVTIDTEDADALIDDDELYNDGVDADDADPYGDGYDGDGRADCGGSDGNDGDGDGDGVGRYADGESARITAAAAAAAAGADGGPRWATQTRATTVCWPLFCVATRILTILLTPPLIKIVGCLPVDDHVRLCSRQ